MSGVSVQVKGAQQGATTNNNGVFSLAVPSGATLTFSSVGYTAYEVTPSGNAELLIRLESTSSKLNEVIVLGYGSTQRRKEQTGAISAISGKEILKSPVSNITNSLVGRVSGVITRQPSGVPGADAADIYIRGRSSFNSAALYVVDGVERQSFGDIDPNEIESISILKDASATALYGIKAGNGVIVITTKTGRSGKTKVSYSASAGLLGFTGIPDGLNAYDAAMLLTEAQNNLIKAGQYTPSRRTFSDAELQKFKDGSDPLGYPDVNWYKALTRKNWLRTQHNLNFSGGTRVAKYFVSFGYMFEDGMYKDFKPINGYRTTNSYTRYNFRSNLDLNISNTTVLSLKLGGRLEDLYGPRGNSGATGVDGATTLISRILALPAYAVPFFPKYTDRATEEQRRLDDVYNMIDAQTFTGINTFNPYSLLTRNGYFRRINNVIESVFILDQKLDAVTKGLAFKATVGLDAFITGLRSQGVSSFSRYEILNRANPVITAIPGRYNDQLGGVTTVRSGYNKSNIQLGFNYNRSFADHNVSVISLAQRELQGASDANAPFAYQGVVLSAKYNFRSRYFVEFNGAYNGSENFAEGKRYGFFPAFSAGYNISEEAFMKSIKWLNFMKIRGSYGKTGYANPAAGGGRFLYLDDYTNGGSNYDTRGGLSIPNARVNFGNGTNATVNPVVFQSRFGNREITWENSLKRNIGFEANLFGSRLKTVFDVFDERRTDILYQRTNSSLAVYGQALPFVNYGENYNKGFEIEIGYNSRNRFFNYGFNLQYSHYTNEYVVLDQPASLPQWQNLIGERLGQYRGYKVIGFYQDSSDIAKSPVNRLNNAVIPGDLKFQDTDGNGIIDGQDRVPIGGTDIPQDIVGFQPTISYKGLAVSALFQGSFNVSSNLIALETGRPQYFSYMQGRWQSPADNETATWPVMKPTDVAGGNSSYQFNSFLQQDASYIKLRNIEIAYQLPPALSRRLGMQDIRFSLTGQNLYTWTEFRGLDPEIANKAAAAGNFGSSNIYPLSRVYQLGVNVQF